MENIGAYISWFLRYLKTPCQLSAPALYHQAPCQLPAPGSREQVIVEWLWKQKGVFRRGG